MRHWFDFWVGKIPWRRIGYPLQYSWVSLVAQLVKNMAAMRETWYPWVGKIPGKGKGYSLQYSGLENPMDCMVHGVAKSWTRVIFTWIYNTVYFTNFFLYNLKEEVADLGEK